MRHRTAGGELAARLRACWHILRGRRVVYGIRVGGGAWSSGGGRVVFTGCTFAAGFTVDGVPAVEIASRRGDVDAKP